jgi:hypothetical protein
VTDARKPFELADESHFINIINTIWRPGRQSVISAPSDLTKNLPTVLTHLGYGTF